MLLLESTKGEGRTELSKCRHVALCDFPQDVQDIHTGPAGEIHDMQELSTLLK